MTLGARARALRWVNTVRYLRPSQTLGRLWFRMARPSIDLGPTPLTRHSHAHFVGCWRRPILVGPGQFCLHEQLVEVKSGRDWEAGHSSKLILYHLHYFDDLVADQGAERSAWHVALLESWLAHNPPGKGTGWEPYVVSLRLVNWIKFWFGPQRLCDHLLRARMERSAALQARWLVRRLERHLMGNHLWANAKALVFAGTTFVGSEADGWRKIGTSILRREIGEQILEDGGHFERSPMYQAVLVEDLLDLLQLSQVFPGMFSSEDVELYTRSARSMLHWLLAMTHPDGLISQFNDAALGAAPTLNDLLDYSAKLGIAAPPPTGPVHLQASGYVRLEKGGAMVLADVAPIGPDYIPGHAHADTLTFEMSLKGRRLFVDGGTSTYERGALRELERSTIFHNTVVVDEEDSSEVWASFRVGRRARPREVHFQMGPVIQELSATHDGYLRLHPGLLHHRSWELSNNSLKIDDRLDCFETRAAEARFRVHPQWTVALPKGDVVELHSLNDRVRASFEGATAPVRVEDSHWSYGFGDRRPCKVLVAAFDKQLVSRVSW